MTSLFLPLFSQLQTTTPINTEKDDTSFGSLNFYSSCLDSGPIDLFQIGLILGKKNLLTDLTISRVNMDYNTTINFLNILFRNHNLKELQLRNLFSCHNFFKCVKDIPARHVNIEILKVSSANGLNGSIDTMLEFIDSLRVLRELEIGRGFLTDVSRINQTSEVVGRASFLTDLSLSCNDLDDTAIETFVSNLSADSPLLSLDLSHNAITDASVGRFESLIKKRHGLQKLVLAGNLLKEKGSSLVSINGLLHLSIYNNPLNTNTALAIYTALATNNTLLHLNVGGRKKPYHVFITPPPDILSVNTTLHTLRIEKWEFPYGCFEIILRDLWFNTSLVVLDNTGGSGIVQSAALAKLFSSNNTIKEFSIGLMNIDIPDPTPIRQAITLNSSIVRFGTGSRFRVDEILERNSLNEFMRAKTLTRRAFEYFISRHDKKSWRDGFYRANKRHIVH